MPQFMLMILENEAEERALSPSATKTLVEGHAAYEQQLRAASAFVDGERLRPSSEGRRVSARGVEPGPFSERVLAAYYVLEAEGLDAALELARACPLPPGAQLDVRPVHRGRTEPDKSSRGGRVFAYAVHGSAPSEQAWIDVMDRIDACTSDVMPADRFLGGVRLQPPREGRRVAATGGRRAVFDGPFLESKEVIGGLFFLRMTSLDEAVAWASESAFMQDGVLEIRELWRS